MRKGHLVVSGIAACFLLLTASAAPAQTIIAELKIEGDDYAQIDDPFDPGEAIIVELGSVTDKLVLRFRSNGGTVNLGAITPR